MMHGTYLLATGIKGFVGSGVLTSLVWAVKKENGPKGVSTKFLVLGF